MKLVKTRKDHKCWACGRTIKKGDMARVEKIYPKEAKSLGMIDVCYPMRIVMHRDVPECAMVNGYE